MDNTPDTDVPSFLCLSHLQFTFMTQTENGILSGSTQWYSYFNDNLFANTCTSVGGRLATTESCFSFEESV